jgi:hypothetical protein
VSGYELFLNVLRVYSEATFMGKYLNQLTLKIQEGVYDETLQRLFDVTLVLAVLVLFTAFGIMYQLGYFGYYSEWLKPAPGIAWPVFPN